MQRKVLLIIILFIVSYHKHFRIILSYKAQETEQCCEYKDDAECFFFQFLKFFIHLISKLSCVQYLLLK